MDAEGKTLETPVSPNNGELQADQTPTITDYEKSRKERIKENLQRMQKLGLVDLSLHVKSYRIPKRAPKSSTNRKTPRPSTLPPSEPPRRSSRLQNVTPVSYLEEPATKKKRVSEDEGIFLREGPKPEVYTEEHEELLGSTERSWELFVDGYGKDGKRIYDPVQGKTCHQCRQKTLGLRTHCSQCDMVQGQFCGDCLYMRYGEHVVEASENPKWICPVCRGICNCSLCRTAKGWPPTGPLHKKVKALGFRSVAHYLIQTRRTQTNEDQGSKCSPLAENEKSTDAVEDNLGSPKPQSEDENVNEHDSGKENEVNCSDDKHDNSNISKLESPQMVEKKPALATGRRPESISLRLRQKKPNRSNVQSSNKREEEEEEALNVKQVANIANIVCSESISEVSIATSPASSTHNSDCISGRLRSRFKTM